MNAWKIQIAVHPADDQADWYHVFESASQTEAEWLFGKLFVDSPHTLKLMYDTGYKVEVVAEKTGHVVKSFTSINNA